MFSKIITGVRRRRSLNIIILYHLIEHDYKLLFLQIMFLFIRFQKYSLKSFKCIYYLLTHYFLKVQNSNLYMIIQKLIYFNYEV